MIFIEFKHKVQGLQLAQCWLGCGHPPCEGGDPLCARVFVAISLLYM